MSLTIKPVTEQLWHRYGGQSQPQSVYIEINPDEKTLSMDWDREIGNAVPMDVWHGIRLRYTLPDIPTIAAANQILDDIRLLAERIAAGHEVVWDGSNHIGRLNDDARQARDDLEMALVHCLDDPGDCQYAWNEDDLSDVIHQVTADTTDAEIGALALEVEESASDDGWVIDFDLAGALYSHRDVLIDERNRDTDA